MYINTKRSTHFPFRTVHGIVVAHDEINTRDVDPVRDSYSFFLPVLEPHSRFADKNYFKKELNCPQNETTLSFWGQFNCTNYLKLELLSPKRNHALVFGTIQLYKLHEIRVIVPKTRALSFWGQFNSTNYLKLELLCPQNESAVSFWGQFHYTNYLKLELNWNYPQNKNAVLLKVDIKWGLSPKRERGSNRALVLGTI